MKSRTNRTMAISSFKRVTHSMYVLARNELAKTIKEVVTLDEEEELNWQKMRFNGNKIAAISAVADTLKKVMIASNDPAVIRGHVSLLDSWLGQFSDLDKIIEPVRKNYAKKISPLIEE